MRNHPKVRILSLLPVTINNRRYNDDTGMNKTNETLQTLQHRSDDTLTAFKNSLNKINVRRGQSDIFDLIKIDYYGGSMLLPHIAIVSEVNHNQVNIEPYDKSSIKIIDKVIRDDKLLNVTTRINKNIISVYFPIFTLERRDNLIKLVKKLSEETKISIRDHRRDSIYCVRNAKIGETEQYQLIAKIEKLIEQTMVLLEEIVTNKIRKLRNYNV